MRVPSWVYSLQITVEPKHLSAALLCLGLHGSSLFSSVCAAPSPRTRTNRASSCGQEWTRRSSSTSSRRPTRSWPLSGTCQLMLASPGYLPALLPLLRVSLCFHAGAAPPRCFGLLLSPGKNVKNSDMHLLDLVGLSPCVCVFAGFCFTKPLLTHTPFRSRWERAPTGSLTSSREAGTPARLSSRL